LELSGTSDSFPDNTENTIKTTNHTINIFMTLCDHCPYYFRLPRSGSDRSPPLLHNIRPAVVFGHPYQSAQHLRSAMKFPSFRYGPEHPVAASDSEPF
jgi:hypothetical protein